MPWSFGAIAVLSRGKGSGKLRDNCGGTVKLAAAAACAIGDDEEPDAMLRNKRGDGGDFGKLDSLGNGGEWDGGRATSTSLLLLAHTALVD